MRCVSLFLTAILVACTGDDTPSKDDTDATAPEDSEPMSEDTEAAPDDTEVAPDADPLGLVGDWSGVLVVTERTTGTFNGNPFDNTSRCLSGTATFSIDLGRTPVVQLDAYNCVEVELGAATMTGALSLDGEGDPAVVDHTIAVSGVASSDRFSVGFLPWSGGLHDDDEDGVMDRLEVNASGVVSNLSSPVGSTTTTLEIDFDGTRGAQ